MNADKAKPSVAVAFIPRERFAMAAASLLRLYQNTSLPFRLYLLDCGTPEKYRKEIDAVLAGKDNVERIVRSELLLPNEMKRIAAAAASEDYIFFLENDCLVEEGCLDLLVAAAEEFPAPVAVPLLLERIGNRDVLHHDRSFGSIETLPDGSIALRPTPQAFEKTHLLTERQQISILESHSFMVRRDVLQKIGPLDGTLSMDEYVDFALSCRQHGFTMVLEPKSRVVFHSPPPVAPEEKPFFFFRWNPEMALRSYETVSRRWNLAPSRPPRFQGGLQFCHAQRWRVHRWTWNVYQSRWAWIYRWKRLKQRLGLGISNRPS